MWGLQDIYQAKERTNHVHHCIDAIVIACMGRREYQLMAEYYQNLERFEFGNGAKPSFPKPWPTFTEDVKNAEKSILVVHSSKDLLGKQSKKYSLVHGKRVLSQGDTARGSLHLQTFYGAIENEGEVKYVKRVGLDSLEAKDIKNIVDVEVRRIVTEAFNEKTIFMNKEKGIRIKKVRVFTSIKEPIRLKPNRDKSLKEYKQFAIVTNEENYTAGIYENPENGRRDFCIVKTIDAANIFRRSQQSLGKRSVLPSVSPQHAYNLKYTLKKNQMVILKEVGEHISLFDMSEEELARRLYKITGIRSTKKIFLRYHQNADKDVKETNGPYYIDQTFRPYMMLLATQFEAFVEGQDFEISDIGKILIK